MTVSSKQAWLMVVAGALACAAVPFALYAKITGSALPLYPPQLEQDTTYYMIHVRELLDGHMTLGNPYLKEYADAFFPGMLLALYIAFLPGLLGLSVQSIYAVNIVLYSLLTAATLFTLCKYLDRKNVLLSAAISVLGVATMHNNLLRPGMQSIFPAFILGMLALAWVLKNPHDTKVYVGLGVACVIGFYMYPYFWMSLFTAVGLLFLLTLIRKDTKALKLQVCMGLGIVAACIPQILSIVSLFTDDLAHQLNVRIGLSETHIVLPITWFNMKYTIAGTVGLLLVALRKKLTPEETMVLLIGAGLFIGSISNVVTGKQMDFDTHFYRMSLPWNIAALVVFLRRTITEKDLFVRAVVGTLCALFLLTSVNRAFVRANSFSYFFHQDRIEAEHEHLSAQTPMLSVLQNDVPEEQVLLTTDRISNTIPLYTSHYLLFHPMAILNIAENESLLERFLLQNIERVDEEFLTSHLLYAVGLGPKHEAMYERTRNPNVTYLDFTEPNLVKRAFELSKDMEANYEQYLHKYNVRFIVTDAEAPDAVRVPQSAKQIYTDDRFAIYEIIYP